MVCFRYAKRQMTTEKEESFMMKKSGMVLTAAILAAMLLAGCGDDTKEPDAETAGTGQESDAAETEEEKVYADDSYMDYLDVDDYVKPGEYIGVEVSVPAPHVSDEMMEEYIQRVVQNNPDRTEITNRAAKIGDVTNISYEGKKDGVAFAGGTADNAELTLGSGQFIDGFEDGVVGMKVGETKDLNLTFPDPYQNNPDLAGAEVVFTVTLNGIYEEKEATFNDAFVEKLGITDVTTVGEYRQYIYDGLMTSLQQEYELEVENAVLNAVYDNAVFQEAPEAMVERYYDRLVSNMTYQASMYGMDLETFMLYGYNKEADVYEADMRESAERAVQQILMLQAIAEKEGMTVSDEEMEKELADRAAQYGYETADAYKEVLGNEVKGYREYVMSEKMTAFLVEKAKVTQTEPETEEAAETGTEDASETETGTEKASEEETETMTETESASAKKTASGAKKAAEPEEGTASEEE